MTYVIDNFIGDFRSFRQISSILDELNSVFSINILNAIFNFFIKFLLYLSVLLSRSEALHVENPVQKSGWVL